jgi:TonB family protein
MTFVRLSSDPTSPYEIIGEDDRYQASIRVSFDSAKTIAGKLHGAGGVIPDSAHKDGSPFFNFQVERQAEVRPGQTGPRYPKDALRNRQSGDVLAQIVVDTTGHTVMSKFRILHSPDSLFSNTVREFLVTERFFPAEYDGHLVAEIIQQPFSFKVP